MTVLKYDLIAARLVKYSAFASSVLLLKNVADAQTVLTDIDPDMVVSIDIDGLGSEDADSIDMNGDGIYDFRFNMLFDMGCMVCGNSSFAQITALGSNAVAYYNKTIYTSCWSDTFSMQIVPFVYGGETIGDDEIFSDKAKFFDLSPNVGSCPVEYAGEGIRTSGFIPLKLKIDGNNHYGWIRFDLVYVNIPFVLHERKLIIHDFAYDVTADEPIETEILGNTSAVWQYTIDAGDNMNGSDIYYGFYAADPEDDIEEYRIFAVKADSPDITLDDALLISPDRYMAITPDGSDLYENNFPDSFRDTDGDLLQNNTAYNLYIFSFSETDTGSHLSSPSEDVLLKTDLQPANITVTDVFNYGDARDIYIEFPATTTEIATAEYRLMISKQPIFEETQADMVLPENYISFIPDGSLQHTILPYGFKDTDGDTITYGVEYTAYIYSIDNGFATGNVLSDSWPFMLNGETDTVKNILLTDMADNFNASDIKINFSKPEHEGTVAEYRAMLVPAAEADGFSFLDAEGTVDTQKYFKIMPLSEDIFEVFPPDQLDVNGDAITASKPYVCFVLVRHSEYGTIDKLSAMSNIITLNGPLGVGVTETAPFIMVYENGVLSVNAAGGAFKNATLFIYNMEGRNMFKDQLSANITNFSVDLSEGLYIINIRTESGNFTGKIFSGR